jgi:protein O-mannosyl-transferase
MLAAAAVIFSPALNFQFVFDDRYQIAQNPSITSWSYLPQYFRSHIWSYGGGLTSYYRPLFLVVLRVWNSLVGLDPVGWHALPIMTHLIDIGLVFALLRRLTGDVTTGLIAAALFAVHPVQIEAVASIYGVTDAIMAAFLLASFLAYLRWRDRRGGVCLALSALLFALGLLTKESAIVFPIVLVAYELITQRQVEPMASKRRIVMPIALAALIGVAYFVARRLALGAFLGHAATPVSWATIFLTAPLSLVTLLRLWALPFGMSAFYDCPYVTRPDWLHFAAPLLLLMAMAAGVWFWSRRAREPLIAFAAIWVVLALLPVLDIRLMQEGDFIHIRFLYVPAVALSLLAAIALRQLLPQIRYRAVVGAGCVVALAISTHAQIEFLHDNEAMYLRGITIAPNNRVPKNNLADDYVKAGRLDEAASLLDDNLRRHPDFWMSNYNRGYIAYTRQNWPEVADYMNRAILNGATETDAYAYRALALLKLGRVLEAEQSVRRAIALRPHARSYHFVLGLVLRQEQRWNEALDAFQQELAIDPGNGPAAIHVADLRARLGKKS